MFGNGYDHVMNDTSGKPPLLVIGGATASGKSGLALALAERHAGAVVSADSRQVYREFDIGTAKPTAAEQARAPHRLIDVRDPTETFTVAEYRELAMRAIAEIQEAGRLPILVGGTGLYLRSLVGTWAIPPVPPDPARRERILARGQLHERLSAVDPEAASRLHPRDEVRLVRALEVFEVTGKPISQWQTERVEVPWRVRYLAIELDREALHRRIDARVHAMMAAGFLDEVMGLLARYGEDLPLLSTLGYRELVAAVASGSGLGQAVALIQQNTRRYAKRQLTWLAREPIDAWLPGMDEGRMLELAERHVHELLSS